MRNLKFYKTEFWAGLTSFLTTSYIVIVNPSILSTPGTGIEFSGALTATVLLCFLMTLLMGVYAKIPFIVAPGMGINAFFTYTLILGAGVHWTQALGLVFWSGILFLFISLTPLRVILAQSIPAHLRHACSVGIGLFLTFIGLKNMGLVVPDPATFVKLGPLNTETLLGLLGIVISTVLLRKKSPFAFLVGIGGVTGLGLILHKISLPEHLVSHPDFSSTFLALDFSVITQISLMPFLVTLFFTDLFDSISTFVGVAEATGLTDSKGQTLRLREGLIVDSWATLSAGLLGTSSGTAYIESASGIEVGGRTGWVSIFASLFFIPCFFIAPTLAIIPAYATAPVLILVGALMFRSIQKISIKKLEEWVPAFLTIILIPLTFSITQGILWGLLSHVILFVLSGRKKDLQTTSYFLAVLSASLLFALAR